MAPTLEKERSDRMDRHFFHVSSVVSRNLTLAERESRNCEKVTPLEVWSLHPVPSRCRAGGLAQKLLRSDMR